MVRNDGILKVLDFGMAGHWDSANEQISGNFSGLGATLSYMSPEQIGGGHATAASDVFSLGLVLYELATGTHPFQSASPLETADAIAHAEPQAPSSLDRCIPAAFDALLLRILTKDPHKRPTALEVDRQLSLASRPEPTRRSRLIGWVAAAITVAAIFSFLIYTSQPAIVSEKEPQFT